MDMFQKACPCETGVPMWAGWEYDITVNEAFKLVRD